MNFDSQKGFMIKYWVIYLWEMPFLFPFQCESSLVGPPARCWCVSSWNGKRLPGSSDLVGDSECHQEVTHWRMDSVVTQKPTFTHTKAHTLTDTGGRDKCTLSHPMSRLSFAKMKLWKLIWVEEISSHLIYMVYVWSTYLFAACIFLQALTICHF